MKWETMRLGSYQGMKNLNAFRALALFFIYVSKKYIEKIALGFPKILHYKKEDLSILKEFIYYRIAEVITVCIHFIIQYKGKLSLAECINPNQMKIILR
jgi:RNase H-fold protein (predicted Holliday junction resolvase)